MMRWLVITLIVAACYFGGDWLLNHPGEVRIDWFGYEVTLHIAVVGLVLLLVALIASFFAVQLWRMATWPARRRLRRQHRTFKRGLEQLTRGVAALSMGDEKTAEEAIAKARLALPGEPLPQLLSAQLLQRQGKHADAQAQFKMLMLHGTTAELATRRLIEQYVTRQEWAEAIKLAEKARETSPRDHWLIVSLIDFYARERRTREMLALTEGWQWQSPLTKEERNRNSALAYYLAALHEQNPRMKEKNLRHAVGYAPDFLPATIAYAETLLAQGQAKRARKWLLEAWRNQPSPLLITPILQAMEEETPRAQAKLLQPFLRAPLGVSHHVLHARHAFAVQDIPAARAALDAALALEESKDAAMLMADIERKSRNEENANRWLTRALDAPQAEGWICSACGTAHAEWHSHCSHCTSYDTLNYERPEARITSIEQPLATRTAELI